MSTFLVTRHGETTWNVEDRRQGWAPVSLNAEGRQQARALGRRVAAAFDIDAIHGSDLRRAEETIQLACTASGLDVPVTTTRAWRERHKGVLQGLGPEVKAEFPEYFVGQTGADAVEARPESGESYADLHDRVLDGWAELIAATDDATILVVTHKGPMRVLLAALHDVDLVTAYERFDPSNCDLVHVAEEGDELVVRDADM